MKVFIIMMLFITEKLNFCRDYFYHAAFFSLSITNAR